MLKKILLPLDGSSLAERSIPHAIAIARIFDSSIELLRVIEPPKNGKSSQILEPLQWRLYKTEASRYLENVAIKMLESLNLSQEEAKDRIKTTILEGKIAENIVDFAHKEAIDLLVICTHGAGGLSLWNLNSVTAKVINLINSHFLIIRPYQSEEGLEPASYDRILMPFDCSVRSECTLNASIHLSEGTGSRVILTSVIKPPDIPKIEPYHQEMQVLSKKLVELRYQAIRHYLEEISQRLPGDNEIHILESMNISHAILDLVEAEADLLILCAHGFTGDVDRPFGKVARDCIDYSTKPVLVIQDLPRSQINISELEQIAKQSKTRT